MTRPSYPLALFLGLALAACNGAADGGTDASGDARLQIRGNSCRACVTNWPAHRAKLTLAPVEVRFHRFNLPTRNKGLGIAA